MLEIGKREKTPKAKNCGEREGWGDVTFVEKSQTSGTRWRKTASLMSLQHVGSLMYGKVCIRCRFGGLKISPGVPFHEAANHRANSSQ